MGAYRRRDSGRRHLPDALGQVRGARRDAELHRVRRGCRLIDADGRSFLDFNCGNGPNLLGYRHPEVDAAAASQTAKVDLAAFFPEVMPAYAERLLEWGDGFDWALFTKNGSDSTNLAMRIMRTARRQPYVVLFESAYHGFGIEIALAPETTFDEQHKYVIRVPWNDAAALLEVADTYGEQVAGVMLNPLDQNPAQPTRGVSPEIIDAIARFRERTGALVTVDDVRNGFRLHPRGSHVHMGIDPDLLCLGKAQANGYSTSTVLDREALRAAAERINFTATYMFSAVAFRVGMATIDIYERDGVFDHIVTSPAGRSS